MTSDEDRLPRKLAAILYADVAEYSRLTGKDEEGIAHFRIFKWYKFIPGSREDKHKWMQERGMTLLLDRFAGGGFYKEKRGAIEKGTLGSGEELTMIPSLLRINEETRHVWIAYVMRDEVEAYFEFIVFFFHNQESTAEISKELVSAVTGSATKMFR